MPSANALGQDVLITKNNNEFNVIDTRTQSIGITQYITLEKSESLGPRMATQAIVGWFARGLTTKLR